MTNDVMVKVDSFVYGPTVRPYYGWHEDWKLVEGYFPAVQQVRSEFVQMLGMIADHGLIGGICLQLGMGPSGHAHDMWRQVFSDVRTIDLAVCAHNEWRGLGLDTHTYDAVLYAERSAPYDFLFIDAGHTLQDVAADYYSYQPKVRPGGLIAFHDALERDGYPEVKVHEFIKSLPVTVFGDEVGTAVMVKE